MKYQIALGEIMDSHYYNNIDVNGLARSLVKKPGNCAFYSVLNSMHKVATKYAAEMVKGSITHDEISANFELDVIKLLG